MPACLWIHPIGGTVQHGSLSNLYQRFFIAIRLRVVFSQGEDYKAAARHVDDADVKNLQEAINTAGKIVTFGVGREGLALKAFAMRLHHLGYKVSMERVFAMVHCDSVSDELANCSDVEQCRQPPLSR